MGFANKSTPESKGKFLVLLAVTTLSCSLPYFSKHSSTPKGQALVLVSGMVTAGHNCEPGKYQVKLQGLLENAHLSYETTSDDAGRYSVMAEPGRYLAHFEKGVCGAKEVFILETNTDFMTSTEAVRVESSEKVLAETQTENSRAPASLFVSHTQAAPTFNRLPASVTQEAITETQAVPQETNVQSVELR